MINKLLNFKRDLLEAGVTEEILDKCFIAGGAVRSILLEEEVKDVDIFCDSQDTIEVLVDSIRYNFYKNSFSANIMVFESENAYTFTTRNTQYQIIRVKTGEPKEIIEEFDFIMNMNYFEFENNNIFVTNPEIVKNKVLEINPKCRNKLGTLARLEKFLSRGYKIGSKLGLLRLGTQISELDPIKTMTQLESESKLYITMEDFESIDFVEKDSESKFTARYVGSCY